MNKKNDICITKMKLIEQNPYYNDMAITSTKHHVRNQAVLTIPIRIEIIVKTTTLF